ncbi:type II CAAX endopeptidase family protein [Staphylococcus coagulans]|uniref:CPBP family intramembrane glutamic endopeptidase n=1 Tax=Staphylococcus coagulans TaxID=74706 RepID=UPI00315AC6DE
MKNIIKIIGMCLLLFVIVVFSQNIAILWHLLDLKGVEYLLHGVTYGVIFIFLIKLLIHKGLKKDWAYFRVKRFSGLRFCIILGLLLPFIVIAIYIIFVPGFFYWTPIDKITDYNAMLIEAVFIGGIVAPIVEEMMFRGVLLKYIEVKTNRVWAIGIASVLFGFIHLFNGKLVCLDFVLLVVGGMKVGVMFGITVYTFNSIWASVILHALWNITGGLFQIVTAKSDSGIGQYVIQSQNPLITGGQYGIDASVISILGYAGVILMMLYRQSTAKMNM